MELLHTQTQQLQELVHYDEQMFESHHLTCSRNTHFIKLCTDLHLQQMF